MKKKLLLSILLIFGFILTVNAEQSSVLNLSENTKAKAPTIIPNSGDTMYATLTDEFDISRLQFSDTNGGVFDYNGADDIRKIILSKTLNYTTTDLSINNVFGDKWFTAYCLDGKLKYPQYGVYTSKGFLKAIGSFSSASTDTEKKEALNKALNQAVIGAIVNNTSLQNVLKSADGYIVGPEVTFALDTGLTINDYFTINGTNAALKEGNLSVLVKQVKYTKVDLVTGNPTDTKVFTGEDLAQGGTTVEVDSVQAYKLTFKAEEVAFDRYNTTDELKDSKYEQALWILEHSYPAITLDATFELTGVTKSTLITQLKAIDNRITDANQEDYLENYVYTVIQFAIWKIADGKDNLGDSILNVAELDKIYKFYIQDRDEYDGYSKLTSGGQIKISYPEEGKELYKTTDNDYTYGPYKASFTGIFANDAAVSLTIKNSDKTGLKIVNAAGTEKNSVAQNEEFYIVVSKNAQVGSIQVGTSVVANTYVPNTNRGRIYYPRYSLAQNLMSGGQIGTDTITKDFTIAVNAKTGVEDVAVLLMVTLVAFSLGYLVLSYKGRGSFLK